MLENGRLACFFRQRKANEPRAFPVAAVCNRQAILLAARVCGVRKWHLTLAGCQLVTRHVHAAVGVSLDGRAVCGARLDGGRSGELPDAVGLRIPSGVGVFAPATGRRVRVLYRGISGRRKSGRWKHSNKPWRNNNNRWSPHPGNWKLPPATYHQHRSRMLRSNCRHPNRP